MLHVPEAGKSKLSESELQLITSLHTFHTGTPYSYYQDANHFKSSLWKLWKRMKEDI